MNRKNIILSKKKKSQIQNSNAKLLQNNGWQQNSVESGLTGKEQKGNDWID